MGAAEVGKVVAWGVVSSVAGHNDKLDRRVLVGILDKAGKGVVHILGKSVVAFRAVELDPELAAFYLGEDIVLNGGINAHSLQQPLPYWRVVGH